MKDLRKCRVGALGAACDARFFAVSYRAKFCSDLFYQSCWRWKYINIKQTCSIYCISSILSVSSYFSTASAMHAFAKARADIFMLGTR